VTARADDLQLKPKISSTGGMDLHRSFAAAKHRVAASIWRVGSTWRLRPWPCHDLTALRGDVIVFSAKYNDKRAQTTSRPCCLPEQAIGRA